MYVTDVRRASLLILVIENGNYASPISITRNWEFKTNNYNYLEKL